MTTTTTPPRRYPCSACGVTGGRPDCQICDPRPFAAYTGDGRVPMYSTSRPDLADSAAGSSAPDVAR